MPYPTSLKQVEADLKALKKALRKASVPNDLITNIATRALRSGRRQTGEHQSNRASRWKLKPQDPQFGSEIDCKIILIKLLGSLTEFKNGPAFDAATVTMLEANYFFEPLVPSSYRDALLLEDLDYSVMVKEIAEPTHGHSNFHIGHHDPTLQPKHTPDNVRWRTHRSNLIQGNMTLREARIYFVRLIARYFELGEIAIT